LVCFKLRAFHLEGWWFLLPILRLLKFIFKPIVNDIKDIKKYERIIVENDLYSKLSPSKKVDYLIKNKAYYADSLELESLIKSTNGYKALGKLKDYINNAENGHKTHMQQLIKMIDKKANSINEKQLLRELLDSMKDKPFSLDDLLENIIEIG
jgi:hypothetical protein